MSDPLRTHLADQFGAQMRLTARILGEYRRELAAQGFTRDEITALCIDLQRTLTHDTPTRGGDT